MVGNKDNDGRTNKPIRLGLRPNLNQFLILVLVHAFVGSMIGLEQTVVPLIGANEFGIQSNALVVSFIASFGLVKAILNLFAGKISDKWGRKNVLILGWLFGIPVPIILLLAPDWNWVIIANVFLGINQGLAWSMTVNMKIDLVGKEKRGFALGFNEFSGYFAVAIVGFVTGYLAAIYGLKPYPFYLEIVFAIAGFLISWLIAKDTKKFTLLEIENHDSLASENKDKDATKGDLSFSHVFKQTSWRNRSLLAIS
jgi:MFS family permease